METKELCKNGALRRECIVAVLAILLTTAIASIGWAITDRVKWAGTDRQIQINTERLNKIEAMIALLPSQNISRDEFQQMQSQITAKQSEIVLGLARLDVRIDTVLFSLQKRGNR